MHCLPQCHFQYKIASYGPAQYHHPTFNVPTSPLLRTQAAQLLLHHHTRVVTLLDNCSVHKLLLSGLSMVISTRSWPNLLFLLPILFFFFAQIFDVFCFLLYPFCFNYTHFASHDEMWPAMEKPTTRSILSKLRLIHRQREHLLLITMVLLFFQSDFPVQTYELLNANNTQLDFDRTRYILYIQAPFTYDL